MAEAKVTLLLVDGSEGNLEMLSRPLARKGFSVLTASAGKAALELLSTERVDLVVLDLMMPEMNGIEVLRRLRSQTKGPPIPVIMATSKAESTDMGAAFDQGADGYVTKPIEVEVLVARIRALLRRRHATAAPAEPMMSG